MRLEEDVERREGRPDKTEEPRVSSTEGTTVNGNEIDVQNKFLVGMAADDITILMMAKRLSKQDALNLAAWIVALADGSADNITFMTLLERVQNT